MGAWWPPTDQRRSDRGRSATGFGEGAGFWFFLPLPEGWHIHDWARGREPYMQLSGARTAMKPDKRDGRDGGMAVQFDAGRPRPAASQHGR